MTEGGVVKRNGQHDPGLKNRPTPGGNSQHSSIIIIQPKGESIEAGTLKLLQEPGIVGIADWINITYSRSNCLARKTSSTLSCSQMVSVHHAGRIEIVGRRNLNPTVDGSTH
jgi:hypothetical protein